MQISVASRAVVRAAFGVMLVVVGCATPSGSSSQAATSTAAPKPAVAASPSASPGNTAAPKPADATLSIVAPKAGDQLSAGPVKVSISYTGPALVPAAEAQKLDDYHLHYFLDVDASPYIGTTTPIPAGNPKIVHTAAMEVTFDNVAAGNHTVAVVMSGNNHISVQPPVTASSTFTVK